MGLPSIEIWEGVFVYNHFNYYRFKKIINLVKKVWNIVFLLLPLLLV